MGRAAAAASKIADRDFRKRGIYERDESTIFFTWEDNSDAALFQLDHATAYTSRGIDIVSWNITNLGLILLPFSASVRERYSNPNAVMLRLPHGQGWRLEIERVRRASGGYLRTTYVSIWDGNQPIYRGEFNRAEGFMNTSFYSVLRSLSDQTKMPLDVIEVNSESELANDGIQVQLASIDRVAAFHLFSVSGGLRWIVDFDVPTSNREIAESGVSAELVAAARELEQSHSLGRLRLVLQTADS